MTREIGGEVPVLVVGAGPAGLAAAVTLARYGVECLVVERRREPSSHPRATGVSLRTMELVRAWGLEDEVLAGGVDVDWLLWRCETLARAADGEGIPIGLPTRAQSALLSPTAPGCVPQDHLERVLLRHLRSLGPARVELGTALERIEQRPDGVRALIRDGAGVTREVLARHVVAADGSKSAVRTALGIRMSGPEGVLGAVTALFRAPLWRVLADHRYGIYGVSHPAGEGVFLPAGPGDRWGYGFFAEPGADDVGTHTEARIRERIRGGAGIPRLPVQIERLGSFSSAAELAERFRHGDVFLVGDAAHRVTPRGGTGMNTAIHGAHDLAWKLAWTLKGWAQPGLLDSYEAERRPIAEHNVARSADPDGSVRGADDALRADLAGRIPHHWVHRPGGRVSTLDLIGPGLTLFAAPGAEAQAWGGAAGRVPGCPPLAVHVLDELTVRALGARAGGAVLVRPDGQPVASWPGSGEDRSALRAAVGA